MDWNTKSSTVKGYISEYDKGYQDGSKETAEKFANEIKAYIYDNDYLIEVINNTLKQFGVEIKE